MEYKHTMLFLHTSIKHLLESSIVQTQTKMFKQDYCLNLFVCVCTMLLSRRCW